MGLQSFLKRSKKPQSEPNSPPSQKPTTPIKRLLRLYSDRATRSSSSPPAPMPSNPLSHHLALELGHVFNRFDANGDGKISWSELGSILASLGETASEAELQRMILEADSDGDGFIDLQEFIDLNTKGVDRAAEIEDLKGAFMIFDLDRNGSISTDELHRVLRSLGESSSMDECRRMIEGVDCDGDGMISFEEFKLMMMRGRHQRESGMVAIETAIEV
ncbi:hypothetical protein AMTRI_Chr04g185180 [Amborella trichopoda]|uniref:probable calcium-binding protein CML10 n=1 Tax=Amborella trichopoda TaxID=13333 RepID=UPI0005D4051A|nr:probable calcium-binding protein CML10 [Amborella trichopoda]|eukprot:XP_011628012.1 probable calcium-binding protein CML10 [Amborella trichopoda]